MISQYKHENKVIYLYSLLTTPIKLTDERRQLNETALKEML